MSAPESAEIASAVSAGLPERACDARAIDFVHRLVATPSLSGHEATAVAVFIAEARALGFDCVIDEAGNGIASRGPGATRRLALLGHIDTVPGDIPVRIEGGILHGRGSVDAKGPLATMLFAAARASLPPGIGVDVIAAVGEETPHSPGARFIRERLRPAACIIGEPSGAEGVTLGYKGRLVMRAECRRDAAHTAGPAPSPADTLHDLWARILARAETLNAGREGMFDRVQCGLRATGSGDDGLSTYASIEGGFRLPPWLGPQVWEAAIREMAREMGREVGRETEREVSGDEGSSAAGGLTLAFTGHEEAVRSPRDDAVVRALTGAIRAGGGSPRLKVKTGTADFNVVAPVWQCPIAAYGPGDSALDHTPREHLHLSEFTRSVAVLASALERLGGEIAATDAERRPGV